MLTADYKAAERVLYYFEEISKIPHISGHTERIADYLIDFARKHSLQAIRDCKNNVIIKKAATVGYESHPPLIIQGHTDMVAAQSEDSKKDLLCDGLDIYVDGEFLRARGTTLGADDGVAVAYALAILESNELSHPKIEAVFTSDEEIGLIGAIALDTSVLEGKTMLNIDIDEEGIFVAGCAGGVDVEMGFPISVWQKCESAIEISISGLLGGHSGSMIDKGRTNAIKLLFEILKRLSITAPVRISSVSGGNALNAIPASASAIIAGADPDVIKAITEPMLKEIESKEPEAVIGVKEAYGIEKALTESDSLSLINLINDLPNGVVAMSEDIPTLVETSLNLGVIGTEESAVNISLSVRSSKEREKSNVCKELEEISKKYGTSFMLHGDYPGWEYQKNSRLRDLMCEVYKRMYGRDAEVIAIHAGLECGIFSDKIQGLDCISAGPDNFDIHTADEHLSLPSLTRFWEYLKEVLKSL